MEMNLTVLICGCMLMAAGMVLAFLSSRYASVAAYLALWVCRYSGAVSLELSTLLFWGAATALCIGIDLLLPQTIARGRAGVVHISGGALAGSAVGMCSNTMAGVICGAALGAFFGAMAFSSTSAGKPMHFPSAKFFNYLAAKGLPATVTMSMAGMILLQVLHIQMQ